MRGESLGGILFILLLVGSVMAAGCSGRQDAGAAAAPSVTPVARYIAGDIIAKMASDNADPLYVITGYDPATDTYTRARFFRNTDGSWGHFADSTTDTASRQVVENVYPYRVAHVAISSIPVITPTPAAAPQVIYAGPAPVVSAISPAQGTNGGVVTVTIYGKNFLDGATAKLLQPGSGGVTGTATTVLATSITTTFNLRTLESGTYNVIIANPDGRSDTLQNAFTIGKDVPVISAISPVSVKMNETVRVFTIAGGNFAAGGVKVTFIRGSAVIDCENPEVRGSATITCGPVIFTRQNRAQAGNWDLRVQNIEGQQGVTAGRILTITNATAAVV